MALGEGGVGGGEDLMALREGGVGGVDRGGGDDLLALGESGVCGGENLLALREGGVGVDCGGGEGAEEEEAERARKYQTIFLIERL